MNRAIQLLLIVGTGLSLSTSFAAEDSDLSPNGVLTLEAQAVCDRAYAELPQAIKKSLVDLTQPDQLSIYEAKLRNYDQACMRPWEKLRQETRATIENVAGFLFFKNGEKAEIICAGFRVTDNLVATAAHCLWWKGAQIDVTRLTFKLLSVPKQEFKPSGVEEMVQIDDERMLRDSEDFALIRIDTAAIPLTSLPNFFRDHLPYKEYLLFPSFNIYDFLARKTDATGDWTKSLRSDKGRSCFRADLTDTVSGSPHCIFNACQTIEAMSGAPILAYDFKKQTLFIGGIHLRAGLLDEDPQVRASRECGSLDAFNVGITLPNTVLNHASGPRK